MTPNDSYNSINNLPVIIHVCYMGQMDSRLEALNGSKLKSSTLSLQRDSFIRVMRLYVGQCSEEPLSQMKMDIS